MAQDATHAVTTVQHPAQGQGGRWVVLSNLPTAVRTGRGIRGLEAVRAAGVSGPLMGWLSSQGVRVAGIYHSHGGCAGKPWQRVTAIPDGWGLGTENLVKGARIQNAISPSLDLLNRCRRNARDHPAGQGSKPASQLTLEEEGFALQAPFLASFLSPLQAPFLAPLLAPFLASLLAPFLASLPLIVFRPLIKFFREGHFQLRQVTYLGDGQGVLTTPQQQGPDPEGKGALEFRATGLKWTPCLGQFCPEFKLVRLLQSQRFGAAPS